MLGCAGLVAGRSRRRVAACATAAAAAAREGDSVLVHYEGRLDDGTVFDSSEGRSPLGVSLGRNEVVPGFEAAVVGMRPGESKTVKLSPDKAYGERREDLVVTVEGSRAPPGLAVGDQVRMGGRPARVQSIAVDGAVTVDGNHELAGKQLTFKITMVGYKELVAPLPPAGLEAATFGAGCFWGVELAFQRVPGVVSTSVGYAQGHLEQPTYEDICQGDSGHTEAVRVTYNPSKVIFAELLETFWERVCSNATTLNLAGNDSGPQYRSGIYFHSEEQKQQAAESVKALEAKLGKKVVTEVQEAAPFWYAEDHHQQYLEKGGGSGSPQSAEKGCTDPVRCYG